MITNYLKKYFKNRKITQQEISQKTGISQYKISLIFNNKRKLTADELIDIATNFGIDLNEIKKESSNNIIIT